MTDRKGLAGASPNERDTTDEARSNHLPGRTRSDGWSLGLGNYTRRGARRAFGSGADHLHERLVQLPVLSDTGEPGDREGDSGRDDDDVQHSHLDWWVRDRERPDHPEPGRSDDRRHHLDGGHGRFDHRDADAQVRAAVDDYDDDDAYADLDRAATHLRTARDVHTDLTEAQRASADRRAEGHDESTVDDWVTGGIHVDVAEHGGERLARPGSDRRRSDDDGGAAAVRPEEEPLPVTAWSAVSPFDGMFDGWHPSDIAIISKALAFYNQIQQTPESWALEVAADRQLLVAQGDEE